MLNYNRSLGLVYTIQVKIMMILYLIEDIPKRKIGWSVAEGYVSDVLVKFVNVLRVIPDIPPQ